MGYAKVFDALSGKSQKDCTCYYILLSIFFMVSTQHQLLQYPRFLSRYLYIVFFPSLFHQFLGLRPRKVAIWREPLITPLGSRGVHLPVYSGIDKQFAGYRRPVVEFPPRG